MADKEQNMKFRRILLKLSGEIMGGTSGALDFDRVQFLTSEIHHAYSLGVQLGIVIGGGNIMRGAAHQKLGLSRILADRAGMLATSINSLVLAECLGNRGLPVLVQSALGSSSFEEGINPTRAIAALESGVIVFFAGGTGNPLFSTDTAAVLRALEIQAEVVLKGTKVRGLFSQDPALDAAAEFIPDIDYETVLAKRYHIMDLPAFALCSEQQLPLILFQMTIAGNLYRLLSGEPIGTIVHGGAFNAQ